MRTFALSLAAVLFSAAVAAADSAVPFRLPEAKVGEWLLYRNTSGDRTGEQARFSVEAVEGSGDDMTVTILYERFDAEGALLAERDIELDVADMRARNRELEEKAKQISRERLVVKDREMTAWAISWDDEESDHEFKLWISDELPIGGMAKSWCSDPEIPAAELIDYGF